MRVSHAFKANTRVSKRSILQISVMNSESHKCNSPPIKYAIPSRSIVAPTTKSTTNSVQKPIQKTSPMTLRHRRKTGSLPSTPSSSSSAKKKLTLMSCDGKLFRVDEVVAKQSQTLKHMIEDDCAKDGVPLQNVTAEILKKVIEYCEKHVWGVNTYGDEVDEELKDWDDEFVNANYDILFPLIHAANYMSIQGLLDLTCKKVAHMMTGKSPEEIRKIFNIQNDYTPEEEEEIRRENKWAFEDEYC